MRPCGTPPQKRNPLVAVPRHSCVRLDSCGLTAVAVCTARLPHQPVQGNETRETEVVIKSSLPFWFRRGNSQFLFWFQKGSIWKPFGFHFAWLFRGEATASKKCVLKQVFFWQVFVYLRFWGSRENASGCIGVQNCNKCIIFYAA